MDAEPRSGVTGKDKLPLERATLPELIRSPFFTLFAGRPVQQPNHRASAPRPGMKVRSYWNVAGPGAVAMHIAPSNDLSLSPLFQTPALSRHDYYYYTTPRNTQEPARSRWLPPSTVAITLWYLLSETLSVGAFQRSWRD